MAPSPIPEHNLFTLIVKLSTDDEDQAAEIKIQQRNNHPSDAAIDDVY